MAPDIWGPTTSRAEASECDYAWQRAAREWEQVCAWALARGDALLAAQSDGRARRAAALADAPRAVRRAAILTAAPTPRDRAILALLAGAGLRASEVCSLNAGDVSLLRGWLRVTGKRGKCRAVPLAEPVARALVDAGLPLPTLPHEPAVRSATGRRLGTRAVRSAVYRALPGEHPHLLRHRFAQRLLAGGASADTIREVLGHASLSTTTIYTHHH